MDGNGKKPRGGKNAARARPAPAADATQQQPAPRAALETPALCDDNAAAAQVDVAQLDVASVDESHGTEADDNHDDDDEQVERFYALLANIRVMRGLAAPHNLAMASFPSCGGGRGDTDTDTAGDSTRNKRLRRSVEPPWRPVFRMEDFEEPAPPSASTSCNIRKRTRAVGHRPRRPQRPRREQRRRSARPPVAVVASSSSTTMPHAAVRSFQQSDSSS